MTLLGCGLILDFCFFFLAARLGTTLVLGFVLLLVDEVYVLVLVDALRFNANTLNIKSATKDLGLNSTQ